jgi:hypothetical protein
MRNWSLYCFLAPTILNQSRFDALLKWLADAMPSSWRESQSGKE